MGGESTETEQESEKIKERIDAYQYIIDSAYTLFDGKYSMHEIETMPYKELLIKIEREQKRVHEEEELKAKRDEEAYKQSEQMMQQYY